MDKSTKRATVTQNESKRCLKTWSRNRKRCTSAGLPHGFMAVGRQLYRKYHRMFCIHSFLAVSVQLVCRKNRLDILLFFLNTWGWNGQTERWEEIKGGLFHFTHKDYNICTILLGSFENTLAFNSSYIHYSTLRCRYIYILIYSTLYPAPTSLWTHWTGITDRLAWINMILVYRSGGSVG